MIHGPFRWCCLRIGGKNIHVIMFSCGRVPSLLPNLSGTIIQPVNISLHCFEVYVLDSF